MLGNCEKSQFYHTAHDNSHANRISTEYEKCDWAKEGLGRLSNCT